MRRDRCGVILLYHRVAEPATDPFDLAVSSRHFLEHLEYPNVGDSTAQATAQSMNRFLNRLPTVTVREGHRVKIYLTSDLDLPAYGASGAGNRSLLASAR